MCSESASSIYLHIKTTVHSDEYTFSKLHMDNRTYLNDLCATNGLEELSKISIHIEIDYHAYFIGTCKKCTINCYNVVIYYYVTYIL